MSYGQRPIPSARSILEPTAIHVGSASPAPANTCRIRPPISVPACTAAKAGGRSAKICRLRAMGQARWNGLSARCLLVHPVIRQVIVIGDLRRPRNSTTPY